MSVAPGSAQISTLVSETSGLVGTLKWWLLDETNNIVQGSNTVADPTVIEGPNGTYRRAYVEPLAEGFYQEMWNDGTGTIAGDLVQVQDQAIVITGAPAYATVSHVQGFNAARKFTASSIPNDTQVVSYLVETAAVLNGILIELEYALPIPDTATQALKVLEHFNARGAWAMSERSAEASPHRDKAETLWDEAQKMLRDGVVKLDAPTNQQVAMPRYPAADASAPFFTMEMEL